MKLDKGRKANKIDFYSDQLRKVTQKADYTSLAGIRMNLFFCLPHSYSPANYYVYDKYCYIVRTGKNHSIAGKSTAVSCVGDLGISD